METTRSLDDVRAAFALLDALTPLLERRIAARVADEMVRLGLVHVQTRLATTPHAWLTLVETAKLTGIGRERIRRALHAGELAGVRSDGVRGWRIARTDIDRWMKGLGHGNVDTLVE